MTKELYHDPELCRRLAEKVMGWEWKEVCTHCWTDCFSKYPTGCHEDNSKFSHWFANGIADGTVQKWDPCCNPAHSWMLEQKMVIEHGWEKRFTWYPPNEFKPKGHGVVGFVKYRSREERDRIEKLPHKERIKFMGPEFSHHIEFPLYGYTADVSAVDPLHATALAADAVFAEKEPHEHNFVVTGGQPGSFVAECACGEVEVGD